MTRASSPVASGGLLNSMQRWLHALNRRRLAQRRRAKQAAIDRRWFALDDPLRRDVLPALQRRLDALAVKPMLAVLLMPSANGRIPDADWPFAGGLSLYPRFTLLRPEPSESASLEGAGAFDRALARADTADACVIVPADAVLMPHALLLLAEALVAFPDAKLVYADEDGIDEHGRRHSPSLRPDWNAELLRSENYLEGVVAMPRAVCVTAGSLGAGPIAAAWWSWLLRVTETARVPEVVHIPHVIAHRRAPWRAPRADALPAATPEEVLAVQAHLDRCAVAAVARASPIGGVHVRYRLPEPAPMVSLIVPTRNGLALLRQCVQSVLDRTTYAAYEIVIVDNGSDDAATLRFLETVTGDARVRVHRDDRPFNFSALNNAAVPVCRGSVLALVNNDIEVITPDWLDEMVGLALRPDVGAVGARLWFPDDTLQHAGVVLGIGGVAGHLHRLLPRGAPGYQARALLTHEFSAVTAACMVLRRQVFEEIGGFDEQHLAVDYNDIDFCLRLRRADYRVVWTPHAELFHHESASRGRQRPAVQQQRYEREFAYMQRTWGPWLSRDPAYNPNLTLEDVYAQLSASPRVDLRRGWINADRGAQRGDVAQRETCTNR